ncbi:MAG: DUF5916 domain-containing protein [Candidatus Krumholzibacteriaceae bacterium]|jgi:hypothetical protein
MKIRHLLFAGIIYALLSVGLSEASADSGKTLVLRKVDSPIVVDGAIDPLWSRADSVSDFVQQSPYHGKEPSRRTVAKVLTTDRSLYCIMICYDERKNIQRTRGMLDDFAGDVVSLMLDTFNDKRTAYKFAVSASGVRADCRLLDDARNRDYNFDAVWWAATRIYDWGFVVEMEIPYRSIQYQDGQTEWGLDFDRWIPTRNEDIYWNAYEQNEGQRISKFGELLFHDFYPSVKGLNLEIYPVGITKAEYVNDSKYDVTPNAGVDVFYNPSQRLTFQLTANPDFAQIEADPFSFNISRYETYFDERRPFFTEGNEVFMPSGAERNSGFYQPLELFYSRRIGKKLPDGGEVPLLLGTRAFGRIDDWEYGGFLAATGEKGYVDGGNKLTEPQALFGSLRLKRQILDNSSVGLLYVGKNTEHENTGVADVDGAFRATDWQLAYQLARSYKNSEGDFASSAGFKMVTKKYLIAVRGRYIGEKFDIEQVGYVPWMGTSELVGIAGPQWYFDKGPLQTLLIYGGGGLSYEKVDSYADRLGTLGINMQFRRNWGYEIDLTAGRAKDQGIMYDTYQANYSAWFNPSPAWDISSNGGVTKTYNFARGYLALYGWMSNSFDWSILAPLKVGTSFDSYVEWKPDNRIEDVTLDARPFVSLTPVNNLNVRVYVDNMYLRSTSDIRQVIGGLLFSYNFRPKSWLYFAINEIHDRSDEFGPEGELLPNRLHLIDRAAVLKLKYLFYF